MMNNGLKCICSTCLIGIATLLPTLLFAQKELKNTDRARYADVGYLKLGFGEVNQQLLTEKQVQKLNRRIQQIQMDYGTVIIMVSLVAEEVNEWENGQLRGLPRHYRGEDPRVARNHVTLQFDEENGRNWMLYGSDNALDFTVHTQTLSRLFASAYRNRKAYRPTMRLLKRINRIYSGLPVQRKQALLHPSLSPAEWVDLARAEIDFSQDFESATRHLEDAVSLDTTHADAYMLLGYAHLELGNWKAAADALERSWALEPGFDTAVGNVALYYLLHDGRAVDKWVGRIREFDGEFKEKIHEMAHYENGGSFIGNAARKVLSKLFQREIRQSELEEMPEAEDRVH